jgi:Type II secretory pathway, pseudopilin PulG
MKNLLGKIFAHITNKKGFSTVESLIGFAVAAGITTMALPSMLPYIDQARELRVILEARYAYTATQQVTLLNYSNIDFKTWPASGDLSKVAEIANCPEENIGTIEFDTYGNITKFVYDDGTYEATFNSSEGWTAEKTAAPATATAVASLSLDQLFK